MSNVGFLLIICNAHLRYTVKTDRRQPSAGLEVNEEVPFLHSQLWAPSHIFRATHTEWEEPREGRETEVSAFAEAH